LKTIETSKITKIGLAAGYGSLPLELVRNAQAQNIEVIAVALNKQAYESLKNICQTQLFAPTQVMQMLDFAKKNQIKHVTFIGKVPKLDFFKNIHKLDLKLLTEVKKLKDLNDDSIHLRLAKFLEEEHELEIIDQTMFLQSCFVGKTTLSKRQATEKELIEIDFGLKMAKGIAALDIGQTVVVENGAVIAVESIEGTNACIKRAVNLRKKFFTTKPITVCKVAKPNQDQRFDVPAIGSATIDVIPRNSIIAIEANATLIIDKEETIRKVDQKNILFVSRSIID
jgi:hypothetical protein